MSFLQPWLLLGLPLVSLPIIIHLVNQRRYQTMHWGAMMFLLAANRMNRGFARLRQWLIMLFRMLVIAGLILAISRPLASGWLGLAAGSRADTTIVLLDRSPSMQQRGAGGSVSKLETGRRQLAQALSQLGSSRYVLIESTRATPQEIESPEALLDLPAASPTSKSADLPSMLRAAYDYIERNRTGQTDVWICSDLRGNDWNPHDGAWQTLRDSFLELPQYVRVHLLAYAQPARDNLSIEVTNVSRRQTATAAELLISLTLRREGDDSLEKTAIPIEFEIAGARSVFTVEMAGDQYDVKDYSLGLESRRTRGWGRVSIPADSNPADNDSYFVFDELPPRKTVIFVDNEQVIRPLQLASEIVPDRLGSGQAQVVSEAQLATVAWEETALLLWQAPLPSPEQAELVQTFVDRGGQVIFFAPQRPGSHDFLGVRWLDWVTPPESTPVATWRGDQDLLSHTISGAALPVGALEVRNHCQLDGPFTSLAQLADDVPLLARVPTDRGGVYFCATSASPHDSSLATNGIVLYVAIQRALAAGVEVLRNARQLIAGSPFRDAVRTTSWHREAGSDPALSTDYAFHRGVYRTVSPFREQLIAINRDPLEEQASILPSEQVERLFDGLDFARVDEQAGSVHALIQEVWRLFLATMMVAMVVEASLCLPKMRRHELENRSLR